MNYNLLSLYDFFFFFNDTATTEIYTLSLHDALPIWMQRCEFFQTGDHRFRLRAPARSEEHTSELQSRVDLVCRLLLEKKKNINLLPTFGGEEADTVGLQFVKPC